MCIVVGEESGNDGVGNGLKERPLRGSQDVGIGGGRQGTGEVLVEGGREGGSVSILVVSAWLRGRSRWGDQVDEVDEVRSVSPRLWARGSVVGGHQYLVSPSSGHQFSTVIDDQD